MTWRTDKDFEGKYANLTSIRVKAIGTNGVEGMFNIAELDYDSLDDWARTQVGPDEIKLLLLNLADNQERIDKLFKPTVDSTMNGLPAIPGSLMNSRHIPLGTLVIDQNGTAYQKVEEQSFFQGDCLAIWAPSKVGGKVVYSGHEFDNHTLHILYMPGTGEQFEMCRLLLKSEALLENKTDNLNLS